MKPNFPIYFAAVFLVTISCVRQTNDGSSLENQRQSEDSALAVMQQNCFSCHRPEVGSDKGVAPPMFELRRHYYSDGISREDFIDRIVGYVNNPTEEASIIPDAFRNFGMMPKLFYNESDLRRIAGYIYDNDLASEEWYAKWEVFKKTPQPKAAYAGYGEMGLNYANATKAELGKNLLAAIGKYGPHGAVEFCNTRAISLTDSMSRLYGASIKRVSDLPRNPGNAANEAEISFINELKFNLAKGGKLEPKIFELHEKMIGYYPIVTNKMCLQCHGMKGTDIDEKTLATISKLYPGDQATGYRENELRGIFVVEMRKPGK